MLVKIKIKDIIVRTEKATLFLISTKEVWLPNKLLRHGKGNYVVIPQWLAEEKELSYSTYFHIPEKIEPILNQEAINELRFNPDECG